MSTFFIESFPNRANNFISIFSDIFDGKTAYQYYTAIHFFFFVLVMTIISMNLMTGLAIANIQKIAENAENQKLALQGSSFRNIYNL